MRPFPGAVMLFFCTFLSLVFTIGSEFANSSAQSGSDSAKPVAQSPAASSQDSTDKTRRKPRKVWTNDEISKVGGDGSISVVGQTDVGATSSPKDDSRKGASSSSARERQITAFRDRLRQLHIQLENTENRISDLRNFKGDNPSASGGINMNRGYSMTSVADQIKQLEEKKKQLQAQIDSIEDQARKGGVEPGELR